MLCCNCCHILSISITNLVVVWLLGTQHTYHHLLVVIVVVVAHSFSSSSCKQWRWLQTASTIERWLQTASSLLWWLQAPDSFDWRLQAPDSFNALVKASRTNSIVWRRVGTSNACVTKHRRLQATCQSVTQQRACWKRAMPCAVRLQRQQTHRPLDPSRRCDHRRVDYRPVVEGNQFTNWCLRLVPRQLRRANRTKRGQLWPDGHRHVCLLCIAL
jgi:hypothetical protein